jgi:hypothetical protein
MLDHGVRPGKEEHLVARVLPSDAVRRGAVLAFHGEDEGVSLRFADMMTHDDEAVSD